MPKTSTDYSRTIIYKIICKDLLVTDIYIGHTTEFVKRKYSHKNRCNNINDKKYNYKIYKIIRDNGNWDNWEMIEIEKYPCNDGNEARARERYWYETLNANINNNVPNRSIKEYRKKYNETNKEKIKEKRNIKNVCECGSSYTCRNKSTHFKTKKHINFINSL